MKNTFNSENNIKEIMTIVLIGIQGAGKSTQGNLLSEKLNIPYLSSGHILRNMAREKTKRGRWIKETINAGILIPDREMTDIINDYLSKVEYKDGFIIDGYPRTAAQAENFHQHADRKEKAFFINVSDKEALWRIAGRESNREDETLKAIIRRIELFHKKTSPVLEYYKEKGCLITVDGERSIDEVFQQIIDKL